MADQETIEAWEKSKRVEAEKMKAAQDMHKRGEDRDKLAYFDPKIVRGHSYNQKVIVMRAGRLMNFSVVASVTGVIFGILRDITEFIAISFTPMKGGSLIFGWMSNILMGAGFLTGVVALIRVLFFLGNTKYKISHILTTSIISLGSVTLYVVIRSILSNL